ncbi:DotU family type IV/VI secretion system protein [Candidatus Cytomitobacter primus]|uniref:DotU family type IV/VI secretion system protein n=1 Tax=Candidatus Cytomitobacter primus TaxID=2066024 RepID=A0A5C0UGH5_9PROT|nr:DotU family type IV/VI secretion system protein [Candidatus Cytomitobacter primus]QEK38771.1 DotU family type IV/VI secretion system protein [Candidatus Cytomitobacter primus]
MINNKIENSFLMNCFQEFINEVLKFRELVLFNKTSSNAKEIQETLIRFIIYKRDLAIEEGTLIEAGYHETSYIMAVFADEIFINLDWVHKDDWKKNNLETQVFDTHIGGRKLFENIDRFLDSNATYKYDIGSAYLFCLGLGFRGKYRGIDDHNTIQNYKNKLFDIINNYESNVNDNSLFPQAKQHTIVKISTARMSSYKVWSMILGITVLIYASFSYLVWYRSVKEISTLIDISQKDIESIKNG